MHAFVMVTHPSSQQILSAQTFPARHDCIYNSEETAWHFQQTSNQTMPKWNSATDQTRFYSKFAI